MAMKNLSAFGIYPDQETVTRAVDTLKTSGFRSTDISLLFPDNLGSKDFAHERHTKAPEGAVAGGSSGAVAGAAFGWAVGAGALMIPGLEALAGAGPILAMMSGMGVGTLLGGLTGAIVGSGVPEYEAKRYAGRLRKGGILLSVHCDNQEWAKTAKSLLAKTGASDISVAGEARADFAKTAKPVPRNRVTDHLHR